MNEVAVTNQPEPLEFNAENGGIQIHDSGELMRSAQRFSNSKLIPRAYQGNWEDVMVAFQMGAEIGLSPLMSLSSIAVINGAVSLWGKGATAVVLKTGLCEIHREEYRGEGDNLVAVFTLKRRGIEAGVYEFSMADAKNAKLASKDTYKLYPKDMLMWKAKARGYKSLFADALCGLEVGEDTHPGGLPMGRKSISNSVDQQAADAFTQSIKAPVDVEVIEPEAAFTPSAEELAADVKAMGGVEDA